MLDNLKVGDLVRLKSSNISMVIEKIDLPIIGCVWINSDGRVNREGFLIETLTSIRQISSKYGITFADETVHENKDYYLPFA